MHEATPDRDSPADSVTIPAKLVQFLEEGANVGFVGTRNRDLVPFGHRVSGWFLGADGRTLTTLVAEPLAADLLESLQDNGEVALTVDSFASHETYQLKGRYVRHRPVRREDLDVVDRIRERFSRGLRTVFSLPENIARAFTSRPGLAVEFEVSEVYLQTPGPGAGTRIVPPAETDAR